MPWGTGRGNRDPSLVTYAWKQHRVYWKRQRLPCARCGGQIDYDGPTYLPGRKLNPRSLVVGHIVSRHRARELGWPEAAIHALSNTQPECRRCSNRSGAKLGRQIQDQVPLFSQQSITAHRW
jgi:hypothetical protein